MTYANAATAAVQSTQVQVNTSAMNAIFSASPVVQIVLLMLVALSVICWAVGLAKLKQFREIAASNGPFQNRFWKSHDFRALFEDLDQYRLAPLARVFKAGMMEVKSTESIADLHSVERALRKAVDMEVASMESRLTLLATTGSTGPFIGLFGTVWGIMGSFHKIGASGSASLAVVAPGISEALIATAIGLAAAIPAVVLYNHFIAQIRREETALNNFTSDFLNMARRQKLIVEV